MVSAECLIIVGITYSSFLLTSPIKLKKQARDQTYIQGNGGRGGGGHGGGSGTGLTEHGPLVRAQSSIGYKSRYI